MCAAYGNQSLAIFIFPLAQICWGNRRLAKTFQIQPVLIMSTEWLSQLCKNNGFSKSIKITESDFCEEIDVFKPVLST